MINENEIVKRINSITETIWVSVDEKQKDLSLVYVAAPEMLAMLKKMLGYANFLDGMYGPNSDEKRDFLALIDKVEGK